MFPWCFWNMRRSDIKYYTSYISLIYWLTYKLTYWPTFLKLLCQCEIYWACNYVCFNSKPGFHYVNYKQIYHTYIPTWHQLIYKVLFETIFSSDNDSFSSRIFFRKCKWSQLWFQISESAISLSRATISTIHLELCEIINIMHYSRIKYTKNFHFIPIRLLFLSNWSLLHFYLSSPYNFGPYSNKFSHSLAFAIFSWNGLFSDNLIKALLTGKCSGYQ